MANYENETRLDAPRRNRVSWGAIFAGALLAIGVQFLLTVFGFAIGLAAFDPTAASPLAGIGTGAIVWFVVTVFLSMFVGGLAAGRLSNVPVRMDGALNGIVVWALFLFTTTAVTGTALAGIAGGIGGLMGEGIQQVAQVAPEAAETVLQETDPGVGEQPLQQRLEELDRQDAIDAIAEGTELSRQEAEQLVGQLETAAEAVVPEDPAAAAEEIVAVTEAIAWGAFIALLLGLGAAALGGAVGTPRVQHMQRRTA